MSEVERCAEVVYAAQQIQSGITTFQRRRLGGGRGSFGFYEKRCVTGCGHTSRILENVRAVIDDYVALSRVLATKLPYDWYLQHVV